MTWKYILLGSVVFAMLSGIKIYLYKRFLRHSLIFGARQGLSNRSHKSLAIAFLVLLGVGEVAMFAVNKLLYVPQWLYLSFGGALVLTYCMLMICLAIDVPLLLFRIWERFDSGRGFRADSEFLESQASLAQTPSAQNLPHKHTHKHTSRAPTSRRYFLKLVCEVVFGVCVALFALYGLRSALSTPPIKRVKLTLPKLRAPLKIAMISDVHIGKALRREFLARIVDSINAQKPDLVVIVGDLVDAKIEHVREDLTPLTALNAPRGVYYVAGNHEYIHGLEPILSHLEGLGIKVLHNRLIELEEINIAGVADLAWEYFGGDEPDLSIAKEQNPAKPSVLLAHQPKFVRRNDVSAFDLVLCGHTHAGQVFPLSFFVWLDQHYVHGHYLIPKTTQASESGSDSEGLEGLSTQPTQLYVSSGAGFWGPAIRFLAPSEIAILECEGEASQSRLDSEALAHKI